jgi:hypothetical protein
LSLINNIFLGLFWGEQKLFIGGRFGKIIFILKKSGFPDAQGQICLKIKWTILTSAQLKEALK